MSASEFLAKLACTNDALLRSFSKYDNAYKPSPSGVLLTTTTRESRPSVPFSFNAPQPASISVEPSRLENALSVDTETFSESHALPVGGLQPNSLLGPQAPPLYSTTGFDMLGILARVASRPNPTIVLGPVDLSCSFVVVDVRRYDHPIVYASETFVSALFSVYVSL